MPQQPKTLPADFFDRQPKTLPADFFEKTPSQRLPEARERFTGAMVEALDPRPLLEMAGTAFVPPYSPESPGARAVGHSMEKGRAAVESYRAGRKGEAARRAIGAVPIVGPPIEAFAERIATGDYAGAGGQAVGMALPAAVGRFNPTVKIPAKTPPPARTAAVQFGEARGVPIDLATATGSPFIQGATKLVSATPMGSRKFAELREAQGSQLARVGENLVQEMDPGRVPGVPVAMRDVPTELHQVANEAYQGLRDLAQQKVKRVQVGMKPPEPTGLLDQLGKPIMRPAQPIFEDIAGPVEMLPVKTALQPIVDRIEKTMPEAQRQSSPGYQALKQIVDRPDVIDMDTAIADLSAIQNIARVDRHPAIASRSQGIARAIVPQFRRAIDQGAAAIGPAAVEALEQGRQATKAKYGAAMIEDILRSRTSEGTMERATGALRKWQNIPPEEKSRYFSPQQQANFDNFFRLAKYVEENPNPSGTAPLVILGGLGQMMMTHPVSGAATVLGYRQLANILLSPNGPQLLSKGIRLPIGSKASAALYANLLARSGLPPEEQSFVIPPPPGQ